jgi:TonB-dependent SusC/RagA subfamily outer membrane receptor
MPLAIAYLIKFSISLSLVYLFYQTLLRRLTFYHWNRWYLMGYSLLSFFIPFFNISPLVETKNIEQVKLIQYIPVVTNYTGTVDKLAPLTPVHSFDKWDMLFFLLLIGISFFAIRLFIQLVSLIRLRQKSTLINDAGTPIYHVDKNIIPFSFGNAIYVNQQLHTAKELEEIILHEYVHVKQKHSIDIILMELVCILNWFNPFAWLLRHAVRQNLEFIADDDVLKKGMDKKAYQYHLLQVVGLPQYRIANSFNLSSLKKRIAMMNKFRSAKIHLIKFLFVLPLIAVLLISFRDKYKNIFKSPNNEFVINKVGIVIDGADNHPLEGVLVTDSISGSSAVTNKDGYYALKIPFKSDKGLIFLKFQKKTYQSNNIENDFSISQLKTHGQIDIVHLVPQKKSISPIMDPPYFGDIPDQPTYMDALVVLKNNMQWNNDWETYKQLEKNHPEVALFYTTEDKKKQVVVLKNGNVEKYGYPNGLSVGDMEKRYGQLPDYMTNPANGAGGANYLAQWQTISEAAERSFKSTNANIRMIIFPGDSRVIAVPKSGKPQVYDMDNADPKERPAFEKLYGKLPSVVPPPSNNTSFIKLDTIPSAKKLVQDLNDTSKLDFKKVLVVIDSVQVPKGIDWATLINPAAIKSMSVYKGKSALDKFGEKGRNGVILIETKKKDAKYTLNDSTYAIDANQKFVPNGKVKEIVVAPIDKPSPLYFIDGKEVESIKGLDQNQIESINVLKDSMAVKQYGERGRNGVILIKTKKLSYHSPSQSDKPGLQNNADLVGTTVHPIKIQPMAILKNNRSGRDTVILIADTIEYNKTNLRLSGTMTIYDSVTASIKGNFFFAKKGDIPFVLFNGKKINRIENFKAVNGQYRVVALSKELAMAKYSDRRAGNGAIEITSL